MKVKSVFLIVLIFLLISPVGQAAVNSRVQISMNGDNLYVSHAPIIMDGKKLSNKVPSFVHDDRTLVHIRFIEENSDAKVDWDQKTQTVTVDYKENQVKLSIDSAIAIINGEKRILDKGSIPRLVKYEGEKNEVTMVPLAFLAEALGFEVGWDYEGNNAYINSNIEEKPEESTDEEELNLENKITDIKKEVVNGKDAIVIYKTKEIDWNIMKFNNPQRIVLDLMNSTLQNSVLYSYDYELDFIKGVRVSQFSPDNNYDKDDKIVRLVLDIRDETFDPNIDIDTYEDKIVIVPQKSFGHNMSYNIDGKDRIITINNLNKSNYSVNYDDTNKTIEIDIPKNNVDLLTGNYSIKDILIEKFQVIEESKNMKVIIKFKKDVKYNLMSKDIDDKIVLTITRDSNLTQSDKLIILDPGHGGVKPGTVSQNGVKEKDITLQISLKTEEALKNAGYNVLMTRDEDISLGLYERADIANENSGDIFVSIHANAVDNAPSVNGIEILYAPASNGSAKEEGQQVLTKVILDELINATGANSRGIIKRPNVVVVRESKMPAILIEVGFLTNVNEEKLITNDDYQNKIVGAIVKGIEKYFETVTN